MFLLTSEKKKIVKIVMRMYVIFIILLQNYEKAIHAHNYRFFWKELCFNYLISPYLIILFQGIHSGLVIMTSFPLTFILETEPMKYYYNSMQFLNNLSKIILHQKTAIIFL